jgi:hypothetical protein
MLQGVGAESKERDLQGDPTSKYAWFQVIGGTMSCEQSLVGHPILRKVPPMFHDHYLNPPMTWNQAYLLVGSPCKSLCLR